MTNVTKLGRHLTSAFRIANVKAYLGLQRSDNLNPVYIGIWSAFAKCQPESSGLGTYTLTLNIFTIGIMFLAQRVHRISHSLEFQNSEKFLSVPTLKDQSSNSAPPLDLLKVIFTHYNCSRLYDFSS